MSACSFDPTVRADLGTAGSSKSFRVSLGLCCNPSLPACLLSIPGRGVRGPDSALPLHTMQPILKPPLVYALLIKGAAKSPTDPSPSLHTNTTKPSKIVGSCADCGEAPLRKRGHRERDETTKEKRIVKKKRKNIYGSNPSEFYWLHKLLWLCYTPSAGPAPFAASFPLWKL